MKKTRHLRLNTIAWAALASLSVSAAMAREFELGADDVVLRWDNTVKYSAAFRLKDADPALTSNANLDDGDRNFGKGLISNRFDLLSELDITYQKRFGARVSAAGWYDTVYNSDNDNPGFAGGAFPNQAGPANQFTDATRKLHGRKAEMLDAFVFGSTEVGNGKLSMRAGKHALLWGESLFFGGNGIAGGQAAVDVIKAISVPNSQFKEFIRPTNQISGQFQIDPTLSVGAYYQFHFEPNRLPAVGSYFSVSDTLQDGAQRILLPPGIAPAERLGDQRAKNSGQGGLQLKWRLDGTDLGFYAIRFHEKTPQVVANIGPAPAPFGALPGSYQLVYHQGITAFGASASRSIGDFNLAAEASVRRNQDLASQANDLSGLGLGAPTDNQSNTAYATGKTAHFNLSTLATLPSTPLWKEATLAAELAWNRVLSVTRNPSAVDSNSTRDAWAVRGVFEPTYRQVLPGLDMGVPVGLGFAPGSARSRALGPGVLPPAGGGDVSLGLNGTYLETWRLNLNYTHFFGRADGVVTGNPAFFSYKQTARDRDFVSVSVATTF